MRSPNNENQSWYIQNLRILNLVNDILLLIVIECVNFIQAEIFCGRSEPKKKCAIGIFVRIRVRRQKRWHDRILSKLLSVVCVSISKCRIYHWRFWLTHFFLLNTIYLQLYTHVLNYCSLSDPIKIYGCFHSLSLFTNKTNTNQNYYASRFSRCDAIAWWRKNKPHALTNCAHTIDHHTCHGVYVMKRVCIVCTCA